MFEGQGTPEEEQLVHDIGIEMLEMLNGNPTKESLMALSCVICEIICSTAPNYDEAKNAAAAVALTLAESIIQWNTEGLCRWNEKKSIQ